MTQRVDIETELARIKRERLAREHRKPSGGNPADENQQEIDREVSPPGEPMPNARRFLAAEFCHADHVLLVHQGGQFYAWDGRCWPTMEDSILRSRAYRWFEHAYYIDDTAKERRRKPFAPTVRKMADLMDATKALTIIATTKPTPSWFDKADIPADELIACENGLIHWPTRILRQHSPRFYVHHAVPFPFDPKAATPARWLIFLRDLWPNDQSIDCLQEMFGYMISGDTRQQKMFLLVGPKRGGKGTIGRVLTRMLGRHNVAGPTLSSLGTNFGLQDLIGKPVAMISDARLGTKSDQSLITERLLSISGEDLQNVDRKFLPPWSGQLPTRFVILTNELPRLANSSGALASRFVVLLLQHSFYGKENPGLTDQLCEELPGIFLWALDGLQRLRERGHFKQPQSSKEAIREMEDLASPVGAFIRDKCSVGPDLTVQVAELYRAYRAWCEEHGRQAVNQQLFGRDLRAVRPGTDRRRMGTERVPTYVGIGLGNSRNSLRKDHCSADDDPATAAPAAQRTFLRESREQTICANCGQPGTTADPLLTISVEGHEYCAHRRCLDGLANEEGRGSPQPQCETAAPISAA